MEERGQFQDAVLLYNVIHLDNRLKFRFVFLNLPLINLKKPDQTLISRVLSSKRIYLSKGIKNYCQSDWTQGPWSPSTFVAELGKCSII